MGTYTTVKLKDGSNHFINAANASLKKHGAKYKVLNGVEYGYFRTDEMIQEDCRFMNEDPEGMKQQPGVTRPITPEFFNSFFWMERGVYIVKISCPTEEEESDIKIMQNWLKTDGKKFVSINESENINRLKKYSNEK